MVDITPQVLALPLFHRILLITSNLHWTPMEIYIMTCSKEILWRNIFSQITPPRKSEAEFQWVFFFFFFYWIGWANKFSHVVEKQPHVVWMELHWQSYLDEMVHWTGQADARDTNKCPDYVTCSAPILGAPEYHYADCFQPNLTCATCCIRRHRGHLLHRIEVRISF